jgi:hypothetical protein
MISCYTSSPPQAPPWRVAGLLKNNLFYEPFMVTETTQRRMKE